MPSAALLDAAGAILAEGRITGHIPSVSWDPVLLAEAEKEGLVQWRCNDGFRHANDPKGKRFGFPWMTPKLAMEYGEELWKRFDPAEYHSREDTHITREAFLKYLEVEAYVPHTSPAEKDLENPTPSKKFLRSLQIGLNNRKATAAKRESKGEPEPESLPLPGALQQWESAGLLKL